MSEQKVEKLECVSPRCDRRTVLAACSQVVSGATEPGESEAGRGADGEGWGIQRTTGSAAEQHADANTSGRYVKV